MLYVYLVSRNENTTILRVVSDFWSAHTCSRTDHYSAKLFILLDFGYIQSLVEFWFLLWMRAVLQGSKVDHRQRSLLLHDLVQELNKYWLCHRLACETFEVKELRRWFALLWCEFVSWCSVDFDGCIVLLEVWSWLTGFNSSDSCLSICSLLLVLWVLSWVYGMYLCIFVGARKWLCICTDWCE